LINTSDGTVCKATTNEEPRKWAAGSTLNLNYDIGIPANYPNGTYKLYMSLPDPKTNLYEKAAYSVRLANGNTTWDNVKGYNYLAFDLTVNSALATPTYTGSSWFSSCYGALPVEWLDFQGYQSDEGVKLLWSTAHEVQNEYFQVEKSNDGKNFSPIGKVNSSGEQSIHHYEFHDNSFSKGVVYYRVAQYDADGSFSYSRIISLHSTTSLQLLVSPNPFEEEVRIFTEGIQDEFIDVLVQDSKGERIVSERIKNTGYFWLGKEFKAGVYVVSVTSSSYTLHTKIVKL